VIQLSGSLPRGAFVSWVPASGRSQAFIDAFQLQPIYVSYLGTERPLVAPLKYGPQLLNTIRLLRRYRPEIVFVMNPPPLAAAAAYLYCRDSGARYIMDCHSGVFESSRWRWAMPLQRFFGRRAAAVIVTNPVHQAIVSSWPGKAVVMGDPPPLAAMLDDPRAATQADGRSSEAVTQQPPVVFVIVRFGKDEAIAETLDAAGRMPEVRFEISGDPRRAQPRWLRNRPPNVRFTGWLSIADFWAHLRRANAVLTLTTQDNAILQGGWEAMFAGQPLITSGSETLRAYFSRGAVFAENTADGIAGAVGEALIREDELRREMRVLRTEKQVRWNEEHRQLERLLGTPL
jgi:hypothetical protein